VALDVLARIVVQQKHRDQAAPIILQDATNFGEIADDRRGQQMGEDRRQKDEVERPIGVRKVERVGVERTGWVVDAVVQVDEAESKLRICPGNACLTPLDGRLHDVKPVVAAFVREVLRERDCHASDAAPDLEDMLIGLETTRLLEHSQESESGFQEVALADELASRRQCQSG